MLHLLPQYQKSKVIKEYRLRVGFVLILALLFVVIAFSVFTMPAYLALRGEKNALENKKVALQKSVEAGNGEGGMANADIAKAVAALKPFDKSLSPILFIDAVAPETAGIQINGYAFNQNSAAEPVNVVLSGSAKTREDLTAYAKLLNDRFGNVKLPLSSLAKASDISFDFRFVMTYEAAEKANK